MPRRGSGERIEVDHRGYTIRWSDNEDMWVCLDAKAQNQSLQAVKSKINRLIQKQVKAEGVPALRMSYQSEGQPVLIIGLAEPRRERNPKFEWGKHDESLQFKEVPRVNYVSRVERATIHRDDLAEFLDDTPETHTALAELERLRAAAKAADEKADRFARAIPRMKLSDLKSRLSREDDTQ